MISKNGSLGYAYNPSQKAYDVAARAAMKSLFGNHYWDNPDEKGFYDGYLGDANDFIRVEMEVKQKLHLNVVNKFEPIFVFERKDKTWKTFPDSFLIAFDPSFSFFILVKAADILAAELVGVKPTNQVAATRSRRLEPRGVQFYVMDTSVRAAVIDTVGWADIVEADARKFDQTRVRNGDVSWQHHLKTAKSPAAIYHRFKAMGHDVAFAHELVETVAYPVKKT